MYDVETIRHPHNENLIIGLTCKHIESRDPLTQLEIEISEIHYASGRGQHELRGVVNFGKYKWAGPIRWLPRWLGARRKTCWKTDSHFSDTLRGRHITNYLDDPLTHLVSRYEEEVNCKILREMFTALERALDIHFSAVTTRVRIPQPHLESEPQIA